MNNYFRRYKTLPKGHDGMIPNDPSINHLRVSDDYLLILDA